MAQPNVPLLQEFKDEFTRLPGGMHGGLRPTLVPQGQASRAINISFRGGYAKTRPGWTPVVDMKTDGATPWVRTISVPDPTLSGSSTTS